MDFARLLASWLETTLVKLSFQANHLLAQRSAGAAKEVKGLIQATLERVRSTHLLVGQSGTALDEILGSAQTVTHIVVRSWLRPASSR